MSLLLSPDALLARRGVARGALAPLATGLLRELEPLLAGSHAVPTAKALLSRTGGRCDCDGGLLDYDPFDSRHRCPRCGRESSGEHHDRFRLYWHQLWLAERTLHAAMLGVLLDDERCLATAAELLDGYTEQYLRYPNVDNVLGPTRPFFSTYLESIWLLQLCIALDLLESGAPSPGVSALGQRVRDTLIAPSAALIASYDEAMSNRQVWNDAALLAASVLLDDVALRERVLTGPSGLHAHLEHSLLADGSWYEGENYHLFAHRGLWYGVQIAETQGHVLPPMLASRFDAGFISPFRTILPDLTYPSRRDSQYAVSVRQPRFAESCELGLARGDDERLLGMLARLYDPAVPRGATGRSRSSADVERNLPATGLTRADLSWRSLLFAREKLPPLVAAPLGSELLPAQGFGVLRRDGGALYVGLDYGHSGGGHGHPDRLNLLLSDGPRRWFDDPGTGSYVEEVLHWYRSTLAHTAPLIDGKSQPRVDGELLAFDDAGDAAWISARAGLAPGQSVRRSVVVLDDYLVDLLEWDGDVAHEIALPVHGVDLVDAEDAPLARRPAPIEGGTAREDGFAFLRDTARIANVGAHDVRVRGERGGHTLHGLVAAPPATEWWSALAPGVPGAGALVPMLLARCTAPQGRFVSVWSWRDAVARCTVGAESVTVERRDGGRDVHLARPEGWRIDRRPSSARGATSSVVLAGLAALPPRREPAADEHAAARRALPFVARIGEPHYRRSEQSWSEAGQPTADVEIRMTGRRAIRVEVEVPRSHRLFREIDAENPYDNEPMAINGDGVQLYVAVADERGGWLLVPSADGRVASRAVEGWTGSVAMRAAWQATAAGYAMSIDVEIPAGAAEVELDLIVNETAPGRVRRRGQLVLSGAAGEFVYLRGDRHEAARLLRFSLSDV